MIQKRLVMKFGGTSVGTSEGMAQVVDIISHTRTDWSQVMVIISALSGVTDLLLECSQQAVSGKDGAITEAANYLLDSHSEIAADLICEPTLRGSVIQDVKSLIEEFSNLCNAICVLGESTPRALDALLSLGERMSARLLQGHCSRGKYHPNSWKQHISSSRTITSKTPIPIWMLLGGNRGN